MWSKHRSVGLGALTQRWAQAAGFLHMLQKCFGDFDLIGVFSAIDHLVIVYPVVFRGFIRCDAFIT